MGSGSLNLNTATLDQLDALPGVSPRLAARVVARRATTPFARAEDVLRVPGFGRRRYERLRPHLAVQGPTTFRAAPHASPPPRAPRHGTP